MSPGNIDLIRVAISYIPPHDRDLWVRMAMAVKVDLGEDGFSIWDTWSQGSDSYVAKDALAVWKSCKANGAVSGRSLFHEAKQHGWIDDEKTPRAARKARAANGEAPKDDDAQAKAAQKADFKWQRAKPVPSDHAYLLEKQIQPHGVRAHRGDLFVPMYHGPKLCSLQIIKANEAGADEKFSKKFLPGGRASGCSYLIGEPGVVLCVAEGFSTGASIREATGYAVTVAFSAGNLFSVAKTMRRQFPDLKIVLCADDDHRTDGNPGLTKATEAARAIGGLLAIPNFGVNRPDVATDFNDMAAQCGKDAVEAVIREAKAPGEQPQKEAQPPPGKTQEPRALGLMSDMRNAWRLVQAHGNSLLHVSDIGFHIWAATHWKRDADGAMAVASRLSRCVAVEASEILAKASEIADEEKRKKKLALAQALSEFAIKCEQRSKIEAALSLVRVYRNAKPGDLDRDLWALNCANGTLDLRSGDLRPHRQDDLLTRVAPVAYDKSATAPRWLAFLDRIFAGDQELIGFVKRAAGYTLTGNISAQVIFLLCGGGANGKSVLVTTLQTLLGDYAKTAAPDLLLAKAGDRHPTELADLRGARMVATVESGEGRRLHESLIKQMTGGDAMKARFMFADFFEFEPQFKLWLATNHKPNVRGTDYAIWRRIRLIPFNVTIPENERDAKLVEKLKAELPGILAWAVAGCLEWQQGGLKAPASVLAATETYRVEMDVVARFIEEACVLHPQAEIKATYLYRAYKAWCDDNGERYESQTMFGRRLGERGFTKRGSNGVIWGEIRVSEDFHSKSFDA